MKKKLGIWFPTVRTNTGTDTFTERLVNELNKKGIRAEITWLPLRAEYAPWSVSIPQPPKWATIVHVNTWLNHRFLPKNLPIIATIHHSIHDPKLKPYKGFLRSLYHQFWIAPNERRIMQKATQVTAVSQFVAEISKKTLCNIPIQVIYNGIDTNLFKPSDKTKKIGKPFRILYIGSWMTRKGVDLLAPIMKELNDNFELYYTGGKVSDKDKHNMPKNMHDLGRLTEEDVIKEMHNADAFLFPSRSEGFGLVVAEAMACGLPVIISDSTALPELVEHNISGLICPLDDIKSFVTSIQLLAYNRNLYKSIVTNSPKRAKQYFKHDIMLNNYIELYIKIPKLH